MIKPLLKKWQLYIRISAVKPILRRYFVINAFDGVLTIFGLIIGAWVSNGGFYNLPTSAIFSKNTIIFITFTGIATSFSMGVSGIWGSFLAEDAERELEIKAMESSMLIERSQFDNSEVIKAHKFARNIASLVNGFSPGVFGVICLIPFILGLFFPLYHIALVLSLLISFTLLVILGSYLGKISGRGMMISIMKMVTAGLIIFFMFMLISI